MTTPTSEDLLEGAAPALIYVAAITVVVVLTASRIVSQPAPRRARA